MKKFTEKNSSRKDLKQILPLDKPLGICIEPDYYDIHHEFASKLPNCGDFGPIAMCEIIKTTND